MAIHVTCPNCQFPYVLDERQAGTMFTCTACDTEFPVPLAEMVEMNAARLPPAEYTQHYQAVVGADTPVALEVMGVPSIRALQSPDATLLGSLWSFRYLFLLLGVVIALIACLASDDLAHHGAPVFLGLSLFLLVVAYLVAVAKGARQYSRKPRGGSLFEKYLVHPFVLLVADVEVGLPAWRLLFLSVCLLAGSFLLAMRVGSWGVLLPQLPRPAPVQEAAKTAPAAPLPSSVTLFPDAETAAESNTPAAGKTPPAAGAPASTGQAGSTPQAPAKRAQRYTSPPPPPDE